MDPRRLILASRSPRRRNLLEDAGLQVVVAPADVDEMSVHPESPRHLAMENAHQKARVLSDKFPEDVVLGADTIVVFNGQVFGKPRDLVEAHRMLSSLAGQTHEVITGVCLCCAARDKTVQFEEITRVRFRDLDAVAIKQYLLTIDPLDKAGGYSAQDDDGKLIEWMEGSKSNVIGLPVEHTLAALTHHFPEASMTPTAIS